VNPWDQVPVLKCPQHSTRGHNDLVRPHFDHDAGEDRVDRRPVRSRYIDAVVEGEGTQFRAGCSAEDRPGVTKKRSKWVLLIKGPHRPGVAQRTASNGAKRSMRREPLPIDGLLVRFQRERWLRRRSHHVARAGGGRTRDRDQSNRCGSEVPNQLSPRRSARTKRNYASQPCELRKGPSRVHLTSTSAR
jgi:hypothetical protein